MHIISKCAVFFGNAVHGIGPVDSCFLRRTQKMEARIVFPPPFGIFAHLSTSSISAIYEFLRASVGRCVPDYRVEYCSTNGTCELQASVVVPFLEAV